MKEFAPLAATSQHLCSPALPLPKSYVFGGKAFGWGLDHEGGVLTSETSGLIKETPESSLPSLLPPEDNGRL